MLSFMLLKIKHYQCLIVLCIVLDLKLGVGSFNGCLVVVRMATLPS